ncbi:MAG: FRG domain-containing protein [Phycisphaerae bacterium]|nr:FRG domain-containing protein [Phycisphaerae bacterium]
MNRQENNVWYEKPKEPLKTWESIEKWCREKHYFEKRVNMRTHRWIFRGERTEEDSKALRTKIEKSFDDYDVAMEKKEEYEKRLIRLFQRKAALYLDHEPDKDDMLEWLAVMQHYGAPTRLMDWTYSFYIAVYFALAENAEGGVVWAFDASSANDPMQIESKIPKVSRFNKLVMKFEQRDDVLGIRGEGDKLKDLAIICYLIENPFPLAYAVNPFRLNERLTVQQGLFLLAGDSRVAFKENLRNHFDNNTEELKKNLHRIEIKSKPRDRNNILRKLRDMNITNEALFPGLEGFAKSVGEYLAYPEIL